MSEKMFLNDSVGSTGVLIAPGIGVLLRTATWMFFGNGSKGLETVELTSKGG